MGKYTIIEVNGVYYIEEPPETIEGIKSIAESFRSELSEMVRYEVNYDDEGARLAELYMVRDYHVIGEKDSVMIYSAGCFYGLCGLYGEKGKWVFEVGSGGKMGVLVGKEVVYPMLVMDSYCAKRKGSSKLHHLFVGEFEKRKNPEEPIPPVHERDASKRHSLSYIKELDCTAEEIKLELQELTSSNSHHN